MTCEVSFEGESSDADPVEFHVETRPRARKAHACHECREPIPVGTTYVKTAYKFEGRVSTDRLCAACHEAAMAFEYYIFGGDFWSHMRAEWDAGAHVQACLNRLTTAPAKARLLAEWRKWKQL